MKMKITPETKVVMGILNERIESETRQLEVDVAELDKLNKDLSTNTGLYLPGNDAKANVLRAAIDRRTQYLNDRNDEFAVLRAHSGPRCMVEIDF
jgi:hypothetical protein